MRVVLDTNVLISGIIFGGKPDAILRMASRDQFTLILSEEILSELEEVLAEKFNWSPAKIASVFEDIGKSAEMTLPEMVLTGCADPDDNRILEAAVEGCADCIVSGDKHLLRMKTFRGIEILTVSDFLLRIGPSPFKR
jgi:putative PIN family toxin of toxin-antitoxin system